MGRIRRNDGNDSFPGKQGRKIGRDWRFAKREREIGFFKVCRVGAD
jgi:hypothetical protein